MEKTLKERNRELCERFPFLIPSSRWSGMRITEAGEGGYWPGEPEAVPEYDYEHTELDYMPYGWRMAFGEQMCEELKQELLESGGQKALDAYRIVQIKEKYGMLRWYDNGNTQRGYDIIGKYEVLSKRTCIMCGKPATRMATGWISPYCDSCAEECGERTIPIQEWFDKG